MELDSKRIEERLLSANRYRIAYCSEAIVSAMQGYDPHERIAALTMILMNLANNYDVPVSDLVNVTRDITGSDGQVHREFHHVCEFLSQEIV